MLERELPAGAAVLGVDEHTAAIIDLDAGTVRIAGRGGVTVRRCGASTVLPSGKSVTVAQLRDLACGSATWPAQVRLPARPQADAAAADLPSVVLAAERGFDAAAAVGDGPGMAQVILGLEPRSGSGTPTPRRIRDPGRRGKRCAA